MSSEKDLPTQGRDAPAYQEFAASMMARMSYRQMSLAERGLLYTLRNECWVNRWIPNDPSKLARILAQPEEDIRKAMTHLVMEFFEIKGDALTCPELEKYRHYQDVRRERMSEGGKKSAEKRKLSKRDADSEVNTESPLQAPSKPPVSGLQALRQDKSKPEKQNPAIRVGSSHDAWLTDYEREDAPANDYARQSRGG